jgi:glycosyltransferase involved in cell wall biosynthesis
MKIIIGHYHLNPGGVTKIIQSQLHGLANIEGLQIIVVCDGQGLDNITLPDNAVIMPFEKLGYMPDLGDGLSMFNTVKSILSFFKQIADKDDIIHFHNIGLGKNAALSYAMYLLAKHGHKLINHAHDFPEDRPANFKYLEEGLKMLGVEDIGTILYPNIKNYIFGVLNSFDRQRLLNIGLSEERVHLWPNPVSKPNIYSDLTKAEAKSKIEKALGLDTGKMLVSYPVRVIRRKNIGEYILLAAAFSDTANFIVTLPPLNPIEIEPYNKWVAFCKDNDINLIFEAGLKVEFEWVMKGADVCFTTSIMESFGMVFVEPWLWGTPVAGREIAAVLPDLKSLGIDYPLIYKKLEVEWKNKSVDFPVLEMEEQMTVIETVLEVGGKTSFIEKNKTVSDFFNAERVEFENDNKRIICKELSEQEYGKKLYKIYKTLS